MTNHSSPNKTMVLKNKPSDSSGIAKHKPHKSHHHLPSSSSITSLLANTSSSIADKSVYKNINKVELVNLIIQSLNDMGLTRSLKVLKDEYSSLYANSLGSPDDVNSGDVEEAVSFITEFFNDIQEGRFSEAEKLVPKLCLKDDYNSIISSSDVYCPFSDLEAINDKPFDLTSSGKDKKPFQAKIDKTAIQSHILFLIKKQTFLEALLLHKDSKIALNILKNDISLYTSNSHLANAMDEINIMSSLIIDEHSHQSYLAQNGFDLKQLYDVDSSNYKIYEIKTRNILITKLSQFISPSQLIPQHRLLTLLNQAKLYQQSRNLLTLGYSDDDEHDIDIDSEQEESPNSDHEGKRTNGSGSNSKLSKNDHKSLNWSLYDNYKFPTEKFPCKVLQTLTSSQKQVWFVKFSHNGKYLAVVSDDKSIIIYNVGDFGYEHSKTPAIAPKNFSIHKVLKGHTKATLYCSWSSDDTKLLSSGYDSTAKIWDVESGKCLQTINILQNKKPSASENSKGDEILPVIRACEWLPNDEGFVAGSDEKELVYYDNKGKELYRWSGIRILDLCITLDSKKLITISKTRLDVWDLNTKRKLREIVIGRKLMALVISRKNPNQVLVHVAPDSIQLWDWSRGMLVKKFVGQRQEEFVIRSCFGGANKSESLVVSGSEDGKIYVWNTKFSSLVLGIKGHRKLVNCVDWNPKVPWMFASASDDETVNIWGPEEALRLIKEKSQDTNKQQYSLKDVDKDEEMKEAERPSSRNTRIYNGGEVEDNGQISSDDLDSYCESAGGTVCSDDLD